MVTENIADTDIGLFAYWWTGIAGDFTARPITESGIDRSFLITCAVLATTLALVLPAAWRLRRIARRKSK
jgi:hypothetical protein